MRLAAIASALAIVLCVAVFGAILLQKASILVPASAPPQATPTESRAPTVADSAAESAVAAPERRQLAQPSAASAEKRFALVIGNAGYQVGALTTPANDAGLIAQTLQAAGFDVVGARDLDQDSLRRAFRDFLEKVTGAGPNTVAFIYVSGYGVQLEGENYFVPIDAKIARASDVAAEAIRMSDYIRPLAALKLKASIVVLDAARANPFAKSGPPLAGGLALVEPEPGLLIAFNAAPGTVAPEGQGPYGAYAQALAEMMREGGLPLADVFDRARLRVNDVTKGAEVPWRASKVETSLVFFERAPDAPTPAASTEQAAAVRSRPLGDLGAPEAYAAALDRDTLAGYSEFLTAYPDDPMAARVRAIAAARREALTWQRTRVVDTPPAYWSYLRRYPQGPHAADAHRRLAYLAAAFDPPPEFTALAYDVPPPPPEEIVYIRRPVLVFDDPVFAFAPPPPVIFLAPPPPEFVVLAPPPPPVGLFVLPMPVYRPVPAWVRPPAYVAPPPNNLIYNNVHNTVVVNNVTNTVTITNPSGQTQTMPPAAAMAPAAQPAAMSPQAAPSQAAPAPAAPAASLAPSLPPSVAQKAATLQPQTPQAGAQPNAPSSAATQPPPQRGQPLPGMKGQPLPSATGTSVTPTTPSAAVTPGTPPATPGSAKPTAPLQGPAAKSGTPSSPSAAITPGTPAPAGSAKPATSPSQTPAATPTTPSAAVTPAAPSPALGGSAKPATLPPQTPAAKPSTPTTPSAAITPGAQSSANKPATSPPQVPAAKPPAPSALPAPTKPIIASPSPPPAGVAKPATPSPHIPAASPPPPAKPIAPAAAASPAPAAAPKVAPPQPKGCPPGKAMAVVNGQPVCK